MNDHREATGHRIDEAISQLPSELRTTLALVHATDPDLAELTLATLPLGSRTTLAAIGVIDAARPQEADAPVVVRVTELGRDVITACALEGMSDEAAQQVSALEEARAHRPGTTASELVDAGR
jgi:hypothetical protein